MVGDGDRGSEIILYSVEMWMVYLHGGAGRSLGLVDRVRVLNDDQQIVLVRGDHDLVLLGANAQKSEVVLRALNRRTRKNRYHG
jgi:hypothetical protein